MFDLAHELTPATAAGFVSGILLCLGALLLLGEARRRSERMLRYI